MSNRPKCYNNEGGVIAMLEGLNTCGDVCCVGGVCNPDTKLCYSTNHGLYRGGCSDQSWESKDCSQICPLGRYSDELSEQQGYPITGAKLRECKDGTYCCGPFNDPKDVAGQCCDDARGFSIDARGREVSKPTSTTRSTPSDTKSQSTTRATTEATVTAEFLTVSTKDIKLLSTASSSTTKATHSVSSSKSASASDDIAATTVTAPTSSSTPYSDSSPGLSAGARIGIGVGSAVAVIAICVALFFFYRERKLRKRDALKHQSLAFLPDQRENYRYESRVELTSDPMRSELEGDSVRVELSAGEVERKLS